MPEEAITTGSENVATAAAATTPASTATPTTPVVGKPSAMASLQKVATAASSAATPSGAVPPKTADAGTTVQPGQPAANAGAQGEDAEWAKIPTDRQSKILENTRNKVREEVSKEFEGVAWAKDIKREEAVASFQMTSRIAKDPVGFAVQLVSELLDHPQGKAAIVQALAPKFGTPAAPTATGHEFRSKDGKFALPEGRLRDESGKHRAYAADQVGEILQNFESYLEEKFAGRISPLEEAHASAQEREEVAAVIHQSRQDTVTLMGEMRALQNWPKPENDGKNPGEAKIGGYLKAIPVEVKKRIGPYASMHRAFQTYLEKDVYPTMSHRAEETARENLRRKAAGGTGTAPTTTPAVNKTDAKPRNQRELAAHLEKLSKQAASV